MPWRRLAASLPLALIVAVVAHWLHFGARHLPGADHAPALLGFAASGAGMAILIAFAYAALFPGDAGSLDDSWRRGLPLVLGLGGLGSYGLIEASEGHAPFEGGVSMLGAIAAATFLVYVATGIVARALGRWGRAFADFAAAADIVPPAVAARRQRAARVDPPAYRPCWSTRGRAPPHAFLTL